MNKHLEELDELIKKKNPELYRKLEPGVPDVFLEAELGELYPDLPDDLKALWFWHNGQSVDYQGYFHPKNKDMLMSVEDSAEAIETLQDSTEVGVISTNNWQPDWVPFTQDFKANYLCVSTKSGEIYFFDRNETLTGIRYASVNEWLLDTVSEYTKL
jgi:cell wall assembly regulator SMI1